MADLRFLAGLSGGVKGFSEGRERRRAIEEKEAEERLEQARRELSVLEREADRKVEAQRFDEELKFKQGAEDRAVAAEKRAVTEFGRPAPTQALFNPADQSFIEADPGIQIKGSVPQEGQGAASRESSTLKALREQAGEGSIEAINTIFAIEGQPFVAVEGKGIAGTGLFKGKARIIPSDIPGQVSSKSSELPKPPGVIDEGSQTVTFRDSNGDIHTILASNLETAKQRDPGLVVIK